MIHPRTPSRRAFVMAGVGSVLSAPVLPHGPTRASENQRYRQLVDGGERALREGRALEAAELFEQAGGIRHEAEAELGLTRAWMQQGEYRRALAFVAHAAGVHRDEPAGSALYAWLLHVGGQTAFAQRVLDDAIKLSPGHVALVAVAERLHHAAQPLPDSLSMPPVRLAPMAVQRAGSVPPASAHVVATALLIGGGRALVPLLALPALGGSLWVRNAFGESVQATTGRRDDTLGLALLSWAEATPANIPPPAWAVRDAFPGSAAFALVHGSGTGWRGPEWPILRLGFLGRFVEGRGVSLGIDVPGSDPLGAPVLDAQGRVVGLGLRRDGAAWLVPASILRAWAGDDATPSAAAVPRLPQDELYERGMALTGQLLSTPA